MVRKPYCSGLSVFFPELKPVINENLGCVGLVLMSQCGAIGKLGNPRARHVLKSSKVFN